MKKLLLLATIAVLVPVGAWAQSVGGEADPTTGVIGAATAPPLMHVVGGSYVTTLPALNNGQSQSLELADQGALRVTPTASLSSNSGLAGVETATALGSLLVKSGSGNLYELDVTSTVAGFLMVFNAITPPADGTVTPIRCIAATGAGSLFYATLPLGAIPEFYSTGVTAVYSSTGCFTKTISATAFIHGNVK